MTNTVVEDSVTVSQAAAHFGVSQQTIWRWIDQGRLPAFRVGPKRVRIRRDDLARVIAPVVPAGTVTLTTRKEVLALGPLTAEERARGLLALQRLEKLGAEMVAARGGRLFSDSTEVLDELRKERDAAR